MRSRVFLPIFISSIVFASCGDSSSGFPTPQELSDALPTVTDMPTRWNESQRQVFDERDVENPSLDPSIWCAEAKTLSADLVALAGESGADVEMRAETETGMPRMMRLQAWANDDVQQYFDDVQKSVEACDGVTVTDEFGAQMETKTIVGRSIGDESVSWMQKTTPPADTQDEKFESVGRTTVARFGSIIMVLQIGDAAMTGESELMNEDDWWAIVEIAAKNLKDL